MRILLRCSRRSRTRDDEMAESRLSSRTMPRSVWRMYATYRDEHGLMVRVFRDLRTCTPQNSSPSKKTNDGMSEGQMDELAIGLTNGTDLASNRQPSRRNSASHRHPEFRRSPSLWHSLGGTD